MQEKYGVEPVVCPSCGNESIPDNPAVVQCKRCEKKFNVLDNTKHKHRENLLKKMSKGDYKYYMLGSFQEEVYSEEFAEWAKFLILVHRVERVFPGVSKHGEWFPDNPELVNVFYRNYKQILDGIFPDKKRNKAILNELSNYPQGTLKAIANWK
jgi:hypothetical protein